MVSDELAETANTANETARQAVLAVGIQEIAAREAVEEPGFFGVWDEMTSWPPAYLEAVKQKDTAQAAAVAAAAAAAAAAVAAFNETVEKQVKSNAAAMQEVLERQREARQEADEAVKNQENAEKEAVYIFKRDLYF